MCFRSGKANNKRAVMRKHRLVPRDVRLKFRMILYHPLKQFAHKFARRIGNARTGEVLLEISRKLGSYTISFDASIVRLVYL